MSGASIEFSDEFVALARIAGYTVEHREGAVEVYNLGGEVRHRVRRDGVDNVIAFGERSREYTFVGRTSTDADTERWLTDQLAGPFRSALGLPLIVTGYLTVGARGVAVSHDAGTTTLVLENEPHRRVRLRGDDPHTGAMFSHVMLLSLAELRASLAAEDGLPLYGFLHRER